MKSIVCLWIVWACISQGKEEPSHQDKRPEQAPPENLLKPAGLPTSPTLPNSAHSSSRTEVQILDSFDGSSSPSVMGPVVNSDAVWEKRVEAAASSTVCNPKDPFSSQARKRSQPTPLPSITSDTFSELVSTSSSPPMNLSGLKHKINSSGSTEDVSSLNIESEPSVEVLSPHTKINTWISGDSVEQKPPHSTRRTPSSNIEGVVLVIDAGGSRGIIPALVLKKFHDMFGIDLLQVATVVSATSSGALTALSGLMKNEGGSYQYSFQDIIDTYQERSRDIFKKRSVWGEIKAGFGWRKSKYSNKGLRRVLDETFGRAYLSEFYDPDKSIVISAYNRATKGEHIFSSDKAKDLENDFSVLDALTAVAAPPYIFPPVEVANRQGSTLLPLADGGLICLAPILPALEELAKRGKNRKKFVIVSLGTGEVSRENDDSLSLAPGQFVAMAASNYQETRQGRLSKGGLNVWGGVRGLVSTAVGAPTKNLITLMHNNIREFPHFMRFDPQINPENNTMERKDPAHFEALTAAVERMFVERKKDFEELARKIRHLNSPNRPSRPGSLDRHLHSQPLPGDLVSSEDPRSVKDVKMDQKSQTDGTPSKTDQESQTDDIGISRLNRPHEYDV